MYTLLEATEWHWPPSVLRGESEALLMDIMQIKILVAKEEIALRSQEASGEGLRGSGQEY